VIGKLVAVITFPLLVLGFAVGVVVAPFVIGAVCGYCWFDMYIENVLQGIEKRKKA
jgi:hypothetical protein